MSLSIVTFADLGKKKNLKTIDIAPVIDVFVKHQELDTLVCRINDGYEFPKTKSIISKWFHYVITILGMVTKGFINARKIEENMSDSKASSLVGESKMVLFHPEYFFQKSVREMKRQGKITIGIATMAHGVLNAELEREEQELLGLPYTDTFYQGLLDTNGDMPDFDYLIAVSDFVKTSYVDRGFPADKIFTASLDATLDTRHVSLEDKLQKTTETFRVVYTAHTNMLKGLHYLLEAWKQVTIPNKELIIIGMIKKNPEKLFKKYTESFENDSSIIWTGPIDKAVIAEYYKNASVFAFPSLTEGNPRVVLEAMAMGIPVITTKNAPSLIEHNKSGFIVPIRDPYTIAEKIEFLYRHPDIRQQMGIEVRRAIETKRSFGEQVYDIYQEICKRENL